MPGVGDGWRAAPTPAAGLLQDDLLAAVRAWPLAPARGLRVGEVLGRDVHPQALGGERAAGDVECVEEAHQRPIAASRMSMRALATWTSASYSRPLRGLGGGLDVDVDGRAVGADRGGGVTLGGERGALEGGPARRHGVAQGRVEVDVDALVAGGVDVGEVLRDRLLASGGAHDGLLESGLSGVVDFHGTGRIERAGGYPCRCLRPRP